MTNTVLVFTAPGQAAIVQESCQSLDRTNILVQTRKSAISSGTELLAFNGLLPEDVPLDEHFAGMRNAPRYPLKYGYASVGEVMSVGSELPDTWIGRRVFAFQPHQTYCTGESDSFIEIPEFVEEEDALFLANMETAMGLLLDGRPLVGERVLVLGAGIVGQLTTALLAKIPLTELVVCDGIERRRHGQSPWEPAKHRILKRLPANRPGHST